MDAAAPHLAQIGEINPSGAGAISKLASTAGNLASDPFEPVIKDFYLSNPIARASVVMAELSALRQATDNRAEAAE